jgi:ribosomal protein S18 acetylase RimI-like enzyme
MSVERGSDLTIRRADPSDAALLSRLAAETFFETFAADNAPDDLAAYMATAFGEEIQRAELDDAERAVFLAENDGDALGYLMLRELPVPDGAGTANAMQVVRLYVAHRAIGTGVGAALMRLAIATAAERGRAAIWLTAWERNTRAIAFYRRFGFVDVGRVDFVLGQDRQTDVLLVRPITAVP